MVLLAPTPRTDYAGVAATLQRLPADLAARQQELRLTTKALALQVGVTSTTVSRFLTGSTPTQTTILAVLRWLASH